MRLLWVCLGGAMGSGARYLIAVWLKTDVGPALAWPTLAVNLAGSFAMGVVTEVAVLRGAFDTDARVLLTAGVLGGCTTYSSFNQELLQLGRQGHCGTAAVYLLVTVVGALALGALGIATARLWIPVGAR